MKIITKTSTVTIFILTVCCTSVIAQTQTNSSAAVVKKNNAFFISYDQEKNPHNKEEAAELIQKQFHKKSDEHLYGRNDQNKVVVFPKENYKAGEYVYVKVNSCTAGTLIGEAVIN